MERFTVLEAIACPLPLANVDTDQLIPARFMSRPRSAGYGDALLFDVRARAGEGEDGPLALERPERQGAQILVARRNFGSGSSREAAVYALADFGIRAVIAPSFGDIFAGNAVRNGLLPAIVSDAHAEALLARLESGMVRLRIDLDRQSIGAGRETFAFEIEPARRTKLLNGWDDLDLALSRREEIAAFVARDVSARPWVVPGRAPAQP